MECVLEKYRMNTYHSRWEGKKVNIIGDSIVAAQNSSIGFADITASMLNFSLKNYGIGGSVIAAIEGNPTERTPLSIRYAEMTADADLVIVSGGSNDWQYGFCPVGTPDSRSIHSFYGALHRLSIGLLEKYPVKNILFMTPIRRCQAPLILETSKNSQGRTLREYCSIIKEVCTCYGLHVLDMYDGCIINPYIENQKLAFIPDGTHPNEAGHMIMAERLAEYLSVQD